jgi:hypothetical protein
LPDALAAQGVDEVAGVAADQQARGAAEGPGLEAERQGPAAHRAGRGGVGEALGVAGEEVIQQAAQVGALVSRVVVVGALVDADVGEAVDGGEQPAVAAGEVAFEVVFADAGLGGGGVVQVHGGGDAELGAAGVAAAEGGPGDGAGAVGGDDGAGVPAQVWALGADEGVVFAEEGADGDALVEGDASGLHALAEEVVEEAAGDDGAGFCAVVADDAVAVGEQGGGGDDGRVGDAGEVGAHGCEDLEAGARERVAAGLVAGEAGPVDAGDREAHAGQEGAGGGARRAGADDQDVAATGEHASGSIERRIAGHKGERWLKGACPRAAPGS